MTPRHGAGRRAVAVVGVCAAVVAVPIGMAEADATPAPGSVITITDCGDGLTVTLGGTSVVGIGLPGDDCPSGTATPTVSASPTGPSICTLPPPPSTPPPSTPPPSTIRATTPAPTIVHASSSPPPPASPSPIPTPPAPSTTPTPTPTHPSPKAASSTPVLFVPSAQTFHAVPFKRLSTVLIVFVIAIVPASIARIRHRRRGG